VCCTDRNAKVFAVKSTMASIWQKTCHDGGPREPVRRRGVTLCSPRMGMFPESAVYGGDKGLKIHAIV